MLRLTSLELAGDRYPDGTLRSNDDPAVRRFIVHPDRPCVEVSLSGKHGTGKSMLLDETDWDRVAITLGRSWGITYLGRDFFVTSSRGRAVRGAGARQIIVLSRWIMKAKPGEIVRYNDRNPLNLRRENLRIENARKVSKRPKRDKRPPLASFMRPAGEVHHAF